jgi:ABC-type iron transport system FetAB permease component
MNSSISSISFGNLALAFVPALAVVALIYAWTHDYRTSLYAIARMLVQLLSIGYFLSYLFGTDNGGIVVAVLAVMLCAASWISMRTTGQPLRELYPKALGSIALGGWADITNHHSGGTTAQTMVLDHLHDSVGRNDLLQRDEQRKFGGGTIRRGTGAG